MLCSALVFQDVYKQRSQNRSQYTIVLIIMTPRHANATLRNPCVRKSSRVCRQLLCDRSGDGDLAKFLAAWQQWEGTGSGTQGLCEGFQKKKEISFWAPYDGDFSALAPYLGPPISETAMGDGAVTEEV